MCLPDSVLRKAAVDIQNGEACKLLLKNMQLQVEDLSLQMYYRDTMLYRQSQIIKSDSVIRAAMYGDINICKDEKETLRKRYSSLKVNDRLKMGIGFGVIAILTYALIIK